MKNLIGIIGDPISHSLSPAMQNAAFRACKLPFVYRPFHVKPKGLGRFVRWARQSKLHGFNVTLPHKEKIIRYLDRIDPLAKRIGAVNTVVNKNGKWVGYNTDGEGFVIGLKREGPFAQAHFNPRHKEVVLLGAGGAARGVAFALLAAGCSHLVIVNRTISRARQLARSLKKSFPKVPIETRKPDRQVATLFVADLLVNTTSTSPKKFPRARLVSDLVYRPRRTPFLKEATRRGMKTHEGWVMLLYQGALSFRLWTGMRAPVAVMKRALLKELKSG